MAYLSVMGYVVLHNISCGISASPTDDLEPWDLAESLDYNAGTSLHQLHVQYKRTHFSSLYYASLCEHAYTFYCNKADFQTQE